MSYTQPERNYIWRVKGGWPGNIKQIPLFTQAGKNGTNIFVARVQNKLSPYEKPYFNFTPKKSLESDFMEELREFCNVMSDKVNEHKNELKLDDELNDSYYDLACGSAMIMREDSIYGRRYRKIPFTDYKLGMETHQTVCRDFKLPAYQIPIMFPELMGLEQIAGVNVKGPDRQDEVALTDILYYDEKTRIWEYYLRWANTVLLRRKYLKSPYFIFHWTRAADMPYGAGVALQALPAMKRLNSYIKVKLELIPFGFPMFLTQSGNFMDRNVQFKPGGIINVRDINAMKPVELSTEKQTFMLEIQTEELEIKRTFLDHILPTVPTQMTATEVAARTNPMDEMVMMSIGKLTGVLKEIGWDLFEDIFNRELAGTVSFTYEQVRFMLDCNVNNDAVVDNIEIDKINGYIQSVAVVDPSAVWQSLNRSVTLERLGEAWNLPSDIRRTAEEIDQMAEEAANAQAEMLNAQVQAQQAIDQNREQAIAQRELMRQEV